MLFDIQFLAHKKIKKMYLVKKEFSFLFKTFLSVENFLEIPDLLSKESDWTIKFHFSVILFFFFCCCYRSHSIGAGRPHCHQKSGISLRWRARYVRVLTFLRGQQGSQRHSPEQKEKLDAIERNRLDQFVSSLICSGRLWFIEANTSTRYVRTRGILGHCENSSC